MLSRLLCDQNFVVHGMSRRLKDYFREGDYGIALTAKYRRLVWLMIRRLDALALLHGTDKASNWHGYTRYYQHHLSPIRRSASSVLEIGVGGISSGEGYETTAGGQSLRMWAEFFSHATVLGIDINKKSVSGVRISFEQGDQSDPVFLRRVASNYGPFDVIIDDGSHIGRHISASLAALWDSLTPGGWYIIEDLAVSYDPAYEGGEPGTPGTAVALLKDKVDDTVLRYRTQLRPEISEMHIYGGIAFLRKADSSLRIPPW